MASAAANSIFSVFDEDESVFGASEFDDLLSSSASSASAPSSLSASPVSALSDEDEDFSLHFGVSLRPTRSATDLGALERAASASRRSSLAPNESLTAAAAAAAVSAVPDAVGKSAFAFTPVPRRQKTHAWSNALTHRSPLSKDEPHRLAPPQPPRPSSAPTLPQSTKGAQVSAAAAAAAAAVVSAVEAASLEKATADAAASASSSDELTIAVPLPKKTPTKRKRASFEKVDDPAVAAAAAAARRHASSVADAAVAAATAKANVLPEHLDLMLVVDSARLDKMQLGSEALDSLQQQIEAVRKLTAAESNCFKRHKRLVKNRESAHQSRLRKKAYVAELERQVATAKIEADAINERLSARINQLLAENASLRRQVSAQQR